MEVIIIAAVAKNNVIGYKGQIPWHISEDFKHFKEETMSYPCIMGDVTYESLPENSKPLPGRENVVLTFNKEYHPKGTTVMYDFEKAINYCKKKGCKKIFITGGATIYRIGMKYTDKLKITRIQKEYKGDTFFPEIEGDEWALIKEEKHYDEKEKVDYSFQTFKRKK